VLHTADWHVGKGLQGRGRLDEHTAVLDELAGLVAEREVDLVLVAGDLFDSASPAPEAEKIVYDALLALARTAHVVVVPGNHDGERRLLAIRDVFDVAGVTIRPFVSPEPIELRIDDETAIVATLPWISQRYIVRAEQLMTLEGHDLNAEFRDRVTRVIAKICEPFRDTTVNLLAGHVTIAGGAMGGGERTAQTIFDYWIDATAFPAGAHYVALGHLHKMQRMPGPCPIYYCGSPLHLDFSDDMGDRHAIVVEAHPGTPATIDEIPLRSGRKLRTIEGTMTQLAALAGTTGDDFLRVRVKGKSRSGLGDEIRALFPEAVKIIVETETETETPATSPERAGLSPQELFSRYLADKEIEDEALVALFSELYEECA
jgi:exonuclease SbcD